MPRSVNHRTGFICGDVKQVEAAFLGAAPVGGEVVNEDSGGEERGEHTEDLEIIPDHGHERDYRRNQCHSWNNRVERKLSNGRARLGSFERRRKSAAMLMMYITSAPKTLMVTILAVSEAPANCTNWSE